MLPLSVLIGLVTGTIGTWLSAMYANLPAGPIIVLVGTCIFLVSAIAAPRRGIIARWRLSRYVDTGAFKSGIEVNS